jgi:hypothetical protein
MGRPPRPSTLVRNPMNTLRTLIFALLPLLGFAPPTHSSAYTLPVGDSADLVGMPLDKSGVLLDVTPREEGDSRDNVALFGLRPTLVLVPIKTQWDPGDIKQHVKTFKKVDKLAKAWERDGFDVLCIVPQVTMRAKGKPVQLDLVGRGKPKHMTCAVVADWDIYSPFEDRVMEDLLKTAYDSEFGYRWVVIGEPGVVTAAGSNVFDKSLGKLRKSLELPLQSKNSTIAQAFDAICGWRLGAAEALITELEAGPLAERFPDEIARLHELVTMAEEYYRRMFCTPYEGLKYAAEHVDELERLAAMYGAESENGDRVRAEAEALRAAPGFDDAVRFRERYREARAVYDALEERVSDEYASRRGDDQGYDEVMYDAVVVDLYPAAIEQLSTFVKEQRQSPYYKPVAMILMELK